MIILFAFWAFAFLLDVRITLSRRDLIRYEQNPFFRFLAQRFRVWAAVAIQASIEVGLAVLAGMAFNLREPLTPIGIISAVFALSHLMAWYSNRRFLAKLSDNPDNLE